MATLPAGTVTFILTDIEGSTDLLQRLGDSIYAVLLAQYRELLRSAAEKVGGREIATVGDGVLFAFPRARDALAAAVAMQRSILKHPWPEGSALRVRIALHTGEPGGMAGEGEYIGLDVHRVARICAAGHGGQILLSRATGAVAEGGLPADIALRDLGAHRLKDLQQPEQIFQILHAELPSSFPPLRSLDAFPNNLPRQMTSFVGREREIADVKRRLSETSLLTLTGAGGCGKTRLALQVAADVIEQYADGVWFVELAALRDSELVLQTAASALSLREVPGRTLFATFSDYLRTKTLLLVLDNCEHVVSACAGLAEGILRSCPRVHILATSREPLDVPGETVWRVPSLSVPDTETADSPVQLMQYEAVRLFVQRAADAQPGFALDAQNARSVTAVCRTLDGIPLAIELATARMRAMSIEQLAARVGERFSLLAGGSRTALPRQQTLRGAFDWSYDLLSKREQALLGRLSVFAGGWTLEAAEGVCGGDGVGTLEILDLLTQLVLKSLVQMDTRDSKVRYRFLETVRQYSANKLGESGEAPAVRTRHLHWYLRLAQEAEPQLIGPDQSAWLDRLELEHDNLRAALEWSKTGVTDPEAGLRLGRAVWQFWYVRGHFSEGRAWLETMLNQHCDAPPSIRAKALAAAGFLACRQGDYQQAAALCDQSLVLFRQLDDFSGISQALYALSMIAESQGDYDGARGLLTESLTMGRRAGEKRRMAVCLNSIGEVARCQGDYAAARASYSESLALSREIQDKRAIAITLGNLGHVELHQENSAAAATLFSEALRLARELGFKLGIAEYLAGLGGVAAAEGRDERAARLLGAAQEMLNLLGALLRPPDRAEYERSISAVRKGLADAAFAAAWSAGRAMTLDQAVKYALHTENQTDPGHPNNGDHRLAPNGTR